ncbi:putative K(+)/H(+) antiporter subunit G [Sterolibacterium denitrificans]|uniref:K(+)/H(+) antiporter subunit G n=1 Tax=Sterolibacterium denitrificans TaxID=157592 RepID=A0A7Z7MUB1_9PROT|nr:monovalent cation/H(+) antiporter subunit G [Sterolibacterium denitrificans]SMB22087.1 putative K(+)/H(+) antiporter subunit G [Sterolibacterium denitrificans]
MNVADVPLWAALPAALLLICGGLLTLVGALGLLRLQSFFARIHAPTMGSTLGAGCIIIASMLVSSALAQRLVIHELLITLFILLTAPVTAIMLMQAAILRERQERKKS